MDDASYFRGKAAQCRRLACAILTRNDPTAMSLREAAREYDASALALEASAAALEAGAAIDDEPPSIDVSGTPYPRHAVR